MTLTPLTPTAAIRTAGAARDGDHAPAGSWELLRALGAVAGDPADARTVCAVLGRSEPGRAEHTEVFVLNCPPYASVYLGAEGGLGGEAADRVAGFWRAMGVTPPAEPDHLTTLLSLYASLGEAATETRATVTADALTRARHALFWEHLWPWLPGYLEAVTSLGTPALGAWANLARQAIEGERAAHPGGWLPLALQEAPGPGSLDAGLGTMLDTLTAPVRSGLILTRRHLAAGAATAGAGHRIGERRFTLRAMLEQAPAETLDWLGREATRWSHLHAALPAVPGIRRQDRDAARAWWAERAAQTAGLLSVAAARARGASPRHRPETTPK